MTFEYQHARADRVVDGDTIWMTVDVGFYQYVKIPFRLIDVDTHEIHFVSHDSEEYKQGMVEKQFVIDWLTEAELGRGDWPLELITYGTGKYGRWLAYVKRKSDGAILNEDLLDAFDDIRYGE